MARQTETRQIEVLRYIHEQVSQKGYPPTVREIGEAVQLSSTSTVHGHLARLEKKIYEKIFYYHLCYFFYWNFKQL